MDLNEIRPKVQKITEHWAPIFEIIQLAIFLTFISSFHFVLLQKNSKIVILSLFLQNLEFICATAELVDNSLEETQTQMIKFSDT